VNRVLNPVQVYVLGRRAFWLQSLVGAWLYGWMGMLALSLGAYGLVSALVRHRWTDLASPALMVVGGVWILPRASRAVLALVLPVRVLEGRLEHVRELVHSSPRGGRCHLHLALQGREFQVPALEGARQLMRAGRPCRLTVAHRTVLEITVDAGAEVPERLVPPAPGEVAPLDGEELSRARTLAWRALSLDLVGMLAGAVVFGGATSGRDWALALLGLLALAWFGTSSVVWCSAAWALARRQPGSPCELLEGTFGTGAGAPRELAGRMVEEASTRSPHRLAGWGRVRGVRVPFRLGRRKELFLAVEWLAVLP
jgi:hypothetical protein